MSTEAYSIGLFESDQFQSSTAVVSLSSDVYFHCASPGGSDNAYFEVDLNGTTGFGGILIKDHTDATGAHDWSAHVHRTPNSYNIENDGVPIFSVFATKTLEFDGLGTNSAPEMAMQTRTTTADATTTTAVTITLAANEMAQCFVTIQGTKADYTAALFGTINAGARRAGAGAVLIGTPVVSFQEDSAASPTVSADVNGNDLRIRVTGVAAENWVWIATVKYSIITE